jgi:hypothetical protein
VGSRPCCPREMAMGPLRRGSCPEEREPLGCCPGSGTAPSCCIMPSRSASCHISAILPPSMRKRSNPVSVTRLPVGAMPANSPSWVPVMAQRINTLSPSAMVSSWVMRLSGKAAMSLEAACFVGCGPRWSSPGLEPPCHGDEYKRGMSVKPQNFQESWTGEVPAEAQFPRSARPRRRRKVGRIRKVFMGKSGYYPKDADSLSQGCSWALDRGKQGRTQGRTGVAAGGGKVRRYPVRGKVIGISLIGIS